METTQDINYFTGPMTLGDTISRGWRLYRLYFTRILTYSLIVIGIISCIGILTKPLETPTIITIFGYVFDYPFISLLFFILFIIFNYLFISIFYNLLSNSNTAFTTILASFRYQLGRVIKFSFLFFFELITFILIDIFLFLGIGFLLVMLVTAAESTFFASGAMNNAFILLMILGTLLYFFIFSNLFVSQLYFCLCQLVILIVDDIPVRFCFIKAFEITYGKFIWFSLFTMFLSTLFFALYSNIHSLLFSIACLITFPLLSILSSGNHYEIYSFIYSILDLISFSISIAIFWPFIISSLTLYYCDAKMRTEGLDIYTILIKEKQEYYNLNAGNN